MRLTKSPALIAALVPAITVPLSIAMMQLRPFGAGNVNDFAQGAVLGVGIGIALATIVLGVERLRRGPNRRTAA